jgi:hypothetical protein
MNPTLGTANIPLVFHICYNLVMLFPPALGDRGEIDGDALPPCGGRLVPKSSIDSKQPVWLQS